MLGHPGERLSAFQTCPWKRSGPSRVRCKWPQTKSWGVSTPDPTAQAALLHTACRGQRPQTSPHCLQARAGRGCVQGHAEPPLHLLPSPCVPCLSCLHYLSIPSLLLTGLVPELGAGCTAQHPPPCCPPGPSPCHLPSTQLGGEPVQGRRLLWDDGVQDVAVPSGPKPSCARQE